MNVRVFVAALVAVLASYGSFASAHMPLPSIKGERAIDLRLGEEPIRIGYRIGLGASLASAERRSADQDGDAAVSAAEGNARLDERTDELLRALTICTGMALDALECKKLDRGAVERVEADGWAESEHLHFAWTLVLRKRATEIGAIRVDDASEMSGIEISDVQIAAPAHAALELAGEAGRTSGVAERLTWIEARRAPGPRSVVAVWPPPRPSSRRKIALLVAIAALLAAGGFWASRRRSS